MELTIDVERNAFADGWRDVIAGDAHVGAHHSPRDAVQFQYLAVIHLDLLQTIPTVHLFHRVEWHQLDQTSPVKRTKDLVVACCCFLFLCWCTCELP